MDEMWSFVGDKDTARWLWHAIDHCTGRVLAYVVGTRQDIGFLKLQALLVPCGITRYYTDKAGVYRRHLPSDQHTVGKLSMQKIERKHLTLREMQIRWCPLSVTLSPYIRRLRTLGWSWCRTRGIWYSSRGRKQ